MANAIVAGTPSLVDGVLTVTFNVAATAAPIMNFGLEISLDPAVATLWGDPTGPSGWLTVPNSTPGSLLVEATGLTPVHPGGNLLTLAFRLTDPAATSLSLTYSGSYGEESLPLALTGLVLGNGTIVQNAPAQGQPVITGTVAEDQMLTAVASGMSDGDGLGEFSYQWLRDGTAISGATNATYQLGDADAGRSISVRVSYQDGAGNTESRTSAATGPVANVNDDPVGAVTITGAATRGVTLQASHTLTDGDGPGMVNWQWFADGTAISGATEATFKLTNAEVGKAITVQASYIDGQGTAESKTSAATATVVANNLPTGDVTITGTAAEGQTLTASNTLSDPDGGGTVSYQWYADGTAIGGATDSTLELAQAHVGKAITVVASYTDTLGNAETKTSDATALVANTNDDPTGAVTITGTATEGQTLTASHNLADEDGLGTVSYQWFAGGVAIDGETGSTLVLGQAQVGEAITVEARYVDGFLKAESVTSDATTVVQNVNDPASGTVTVTGIYKQGETLTASNSLADEDGLGTIQYQWLADGEPISGANGGTFVLTQAQVGKIITAQASFVDDEGTPESVTSSTVGVDPVEDIDDAMTGNVAIVGAATKGQTLSIDNTLADPDGIVGGAGGFTYEWLANGTVVLGTGSTYTLTDNELGDTISVRVTYTDAFGSHSATSASTAPVILNNLPVGTVTITGTPTEGQTLTASSSLTDADNDGSTVASVTYHWLADGVEIGTTGPTLVLGQDQVGKQITVQARYIDELGVEEAPSSAPTLAVENVNQPATGAVTISGTVQQGQVLTAVTGALVDPDGLGTFEYQWFANGSAISGATGQTFTLTHAEVDKTLTVRVNFKDQWNTDESVTSSPTAAVANLDDAPTGTVSIAGTYEQGQMLTASNTLADLDGIGTVSYQWLANGTPISGATGQTFVLTQDQVGKAISVRASYTDGFGKAESVDSADSPTVGNVDDVPTGTVTVSGTPTQGQTLTAANTLADLDGMGPVSYQWLSNGAAIGGATSSTYTLTQAEVGTVVTVRASYQDLQGKNESVDSTAGAPIQNANDLPTGTVTIGGTATQGQLLTASNDLADLDGLGAVSYQWLANGMAIAGATSATYELSQAEVGKQITVRASYTDALGQAESVTSAATGAVGNVNDAPTGTVTISGTPQQGQALTAVTSALGDPDGLGTFSYQWLAGGLDIGGATGATFTPSQAEVGDAISVRVTYTDALGTVENVASAPTAAVANTNDAPTGTVSIAGTVTQGQTLTASNTLADADGMGTVGYQWLADGQAIAGATSNTLVLQQAQVGKAITVQASYTDGFGQAEARTSAATARVANVNDAVTGTLVINGVATQGATLSADTSGLVDADGLGAFSYQWLADGTAIAGATASSLTLTQAQVSKAITVRVNYTDGHGTPESTASVATANVENVNDIPTGAVAAEGARVAGLPMKANTSSLADLDGLGTLNYQWYVDDIAVGTNSSTYTPVAADGGKAIKVTVTYTDGFGASESVTSAAVNLMAEDDAPAVVINGVAGIAGDGNGDGLVDSVQEQVVSAPFTSSSSNQDVFVTLVADSSAGTVNSGSTTTFQNIRQEAPPAEKPAALDMPLGLIDFTATVASVGKTEAFSLFVDASLGANGYWKKDAGGVWHNLASEPYGGSTTLVGNKIRLDFQITDGGRFDNDGIANGVIVDPGAIGAMPLSVVGYAPDVVLTPDSHFFF